MTRSIHMEFQGTMAGKPLRVIQTVRYTHLRTASGQRPDWVDEARITVDGDGDEDENRDGRRGRSNV